ncbi:MAG TPA: PilZ domain-containing protein [Candidatus Eisenbacteria bacterium]|nr:PilZ domain-containing protein [Candidatus Eisenbacteria bacterium]
MERITPRYVFEARIRISVQRASQNLAMEGWARDISETGISAFVAQGLIVGERVTLEVPLGASQWHSIPAKVARCIGTQYGFQFTALSPVQREFIRLAVRDQPETGAYGRPADAKLREHQREAETRLSAQEPETPHAADTAFADRARMLIKRGYTPKVAVELVLHEMEFEQGNNSRAMEKVRADAEDFLTKARRGLI